MSRDGNFIFSRRRVAALSAKRVLMKAIVWRGWIPGSCAWRATGAFRLRAEGKEAAIDLRLVSRKPPVIHGEDGVSQKAAGAGHASHYYSLTRLATEGEVRMVTEDVSGYGRELVRSRMGDQSARAEAGRLGLALASSWMTGAS